MVNRINSKGIKRLWPLRKKISPFKVEFTLLPSRSSNDVIANGGLLVRMLVHLKREGQATFSSPIKVNPVFDKTRFMGKRTLHVSQRPMKA